MTTRRKKLWYLPDGTVSEVYVPGAQSSPFDISAPVGTLERSALEREAKKTPKPPELLGFDKALRRLYPQTFTEGLNLGEAPEVTTDKLLKQIQKDLKESPDIFLDDFRKKRLPDEQKALMKYLNPDLPDEDVDDFLKPLTENKLMTTVSKIPELSDFSLEDVVSQAEADPDAFLSKLVAEGLTPEKKNLLRTMGFSRQEIELLESEFKPIVSQRPLPAVQQAKIQAALLPGQKAIPSLKLGATGFEGYKMPQITTPAGNKIDYPMTSKEWTSMTAAERVAFQADPQKWLSERQDWSKLRVATDRLKIVAESLGITPPTDLNNPAEQWRLAYEVALWLPAADVGLAGKAGYGLLKKVLPKTAKEFLAGMEQVISRIAKTDVKDIVRLGKGKVAQETAQQVKQVADDALKTVKAVPEEIDLSDLQLKVNQDDAVKAGGLLEKQGDQIKATNPKGETQLFKDSDSALEFVRGEKPFEPSIPRPIPGEPEPGLQAGMFGEEKIVRPKGKGVVTQISMEDQLRLQKAREADVGSQVMRETLESDPVASYKIPQQVTRTVTKNGVKTQTTSTRNVSLESFISLREQSFPEYFTVKQARQLLGEGFDLSKYEQQGTKLYNHVPRDVALEKVAQDLGMSADEVADRVMQARVTRNTIRDLEDDARFLSEESGVTDTEVIEKVADYERVLDEGVPPADRPPRPPQAIIRPDPVPEMPKNSEIKRIIAQSEEQVRQDQPKAITNLTRKIPGVKQLMEFERPGLKMTGENKKVLTAMVAENAARSDVSVWAMSTRLQLLKDLRAAFGDDVLHGAKSKVKFLGTPEQAKNPITGTLLDMAQNPELYELSERQLAHLMDINMHNDQLLDWVVSNYGADIGRFTPKPNGAYLPNVDVGDDVVEVMMSESRAVSSGRGKTRVWPTARDRMAGKTPFTPELDVQKLIEGLDNSKASAAAGNTYKEAIGGLTRLEAIEKTHPDLFKKMDFLRKELNSLKGSSITIESNLHTGIDDFLKSSVEDTDLLELKNTLDVRLKAGKRKGLDMSDIQDRITAVQDQIDELRPAWKAANLKPYTFVQDGLYRYFPAEQAALIKESRAMTNNRLLGIIEKWRGQSFSGDFSPFTIQGVGGVLADPWGSLQAGIGGAKSAIKHRDFLRSVSIDALADDISRNAVEWGEYASLMGRSLTGTPKEYAAGFLSKIPGFDKFTENTFVTVTRGSFNLWDRTWRNMVKHGTPVLEAKVAAADVASKVYPLVSQTRLGQSQARHAVLRALPTSYSFIRQPVTLTADALRGMGKLATFQKLTPAESLAVKVAVTGAASTLAVSATSAFISAQAQGKSDDEAWQAALDAINPHPMNGKFASLIIGNVRIPLGGPYRALFRAMYPAQVKGVPFPVPFAGLPNYLKNRISPAIKTQLDLAPVLIGKPEAAVDYNKVQIFNTKDGSVFENILRALEYEFENILPLTLGTVAEATRQGDKYKEPLWQQVLGQFIGTNPVTLDNTYIDRQIKQLGMEKQGEAKPFTIQKPEVFDTKDLYGDISGVLKKREGEGFKDKPLTLAIKETMTIKDTADRFLNAKLASLTDDQWNLLQQRQELDDTTEFDKINPLLSKVSQRDYLLLKEYKGLDKKAQTQFLKDHPELTLNPRHDWLKSHPKENAQLALFGQAKVLTKEAYNEVLRLAKELDIPDSAVPDLGIPKESVDDYFKYQDSVSEGTESSWETQLMLAKDDKLREFLGLKKNDTPVESLELKVKNRENFDKLEAYSDPDSPDYIEDEDKRAEAVKKLKVGTPFGDDIRRIEAIEKGGDEKTQKSHIDYGKLIDEEGKGSSSADVMLFRADNPEYDKWRQDKEVWGDQVLKPLDEAMIPKWRIDVKYAKEDTEYDAIKADLPAEQARLRQEYLDKHIEYRLDRRRREAMTLSNSLTGYKFPEEQIEDYVAFNDLPSKGKRRDRYLIQNPEFAQAMLQAGQLADIPLRVPDKAYDDIYDTYQAEFDELDSLADPESPAFVSDPVAREQARQALRFDENGVYTEFGLAELKRNAYGKYVPEKHVQNYVDYYQIVGEGKGDDYLAKNKTDLWYEDDWWMIEHPDFYQEVYLGLLGNQRKDYRKVPLTPEGKPNREVFDKYLDYVQLTTDYWRDTFRKANPDLDEWGQIAFGWKPIIKQKTTKASERDYALEDIRLRQREFEKLVGAR